MRAGRPWSFIAATIVAMALLALMPRLAAVVVRGAIERDSAAERATFEAGGSPWSWRFRAPDDVIAGRAFGGATVEGGRDGLTLRATDGSAAEVGFPLFRTADIRRIDELHLQVAASTPVHAFLAVREGLDEPTRHADVGELMPGASGRRIALPALDWRDDDGRPIAAPTRAAMLRLGVVMPVGTSVVLRSAALLPSSGIVEPHAGSLPGRLGAEALLAWRDNQRAADPLVTFDQGLRRPAPAWLEAVPPAVYAALLIVAAVAWRRPGAQRAKDIAKALLVLAGPLWFIASLGFDGRPALAGIATFGLGVAYAALLAWRHDPPAWHWGGAWRSAGWPFLAVVVAAALVALVGHRLAWPLPGRALVYVAWAVFQQWLVLAVAGALLDRALPRAWAVLLTALAFALLHTPNGVLMQLCFVAELGWAWWFLRHRSLLPVALAHAASALLVQAGLAGGILRSLEVSGRFLN